MFLILLSLDKLEQGSFSIPFAVLNFKHLLFTTLRWLRLFSAVSVTLTIHFCDFSCLFAILKKIIEEFFVNVNFVMPKNSAGRIHPVNAISCALTRRIRLTCNLKLSEDGRQE